MHKALVDWLADPVSGEPLRLESRVTDGDEVLEGMLHSPSGRAYPVRDGIPRFVLTTDARQRQTSDSFGFKWSQRSTYDTAQSLETARAWFMERYGFTSLEDMRAYFGSRRRMLDAGCGGGFSTSLWLAAPPQAWVGMDISDAVAVAKERLGRFANTHFIQADLLQLPFRPGVFDTVIAEGVLHHTPSTERALRALIGALAPGGEALFYVYRRKSPIREFTDDHVRAAVAALPPEQAWEALRPLTRLGQALAELHTEVEVPEDIATLGIKAGRYDVQRLIYWHFAKLFWNAQLTFEENHHRNFDWYHPRYAHRHTEEEVRGWCAATGLSITRFNVQEAGFSVRALKQGGACAGS